MGRWTADYYDDVLVSKIKGLVAGSIQRAFLEKSEPSISYEAFVEDIDPGDSFTASLIDVLVREIAERRTRPSTADRRLIADRTAKCLRQLAMPLRVYRERSAPRNMLSTRVNLSDYLAAPQDEMDIEEEDDDFDNMLGHTAIEGVRVNTEIYEAYAPTPTWSTIQPRRSHESYSAALTSQDNANENVAPASRGAQWSFAPNTVPTSLQRQSSIRRPPRSRTVDFNDFTSRRRSSIRHNTAQESAGSRSDGTVDDYVLLNVPPLIPSDDESSTPQPQNEQSSTHRSAPARRWFPMRSRSRREAAVWRNEGISEAGWVPEEPTPSSGWFSIPTPMSSSSSQDADSSEERALPAPRLRRGGVRAPESIVPRHSSPLVELVTGASRAEVTTLNLPPSPRSPVRSENVVLESAAPAETPIASEALPTVGRTDNAESSTVASVS